MTSEFSFPFIRNVVIKAVVLFLLLNLIFTALSPMSFLGRISGYNFLFPGRERFPFGEESEKSYNLSMYNLDAMFASLQLNSHSKPGGEFRVFLIGDSSVWGTLLRPEETLAGQINRLHLETCHNKVVKVYNLGYPTISLTKDLMVLDQAVKYKPDLIIWLTTLEAFPKEKQLSSPIVANNSDSVRSLISRYQLKLNPDDPELKKSDLFVRSIIGKRRELEDLFRLQFYGVLWGATQIDQVYPINYPQAQRDLEADESFHELKPGDGITDGLAMDVLNAGMNAVDLGRIILVNEPIMMSSGKNSDIRYNFFYPKWAYDDYRKTLSIQAKQAGWNYIDLWNKISEKEFTNSAIHLSSRGSAELAGLLAPVILNMTCK